MDKIYSWSADQQLIVTGQGRSNGHLLDHVNPQPDHGNLVQSVRVQRVIEEVNHRPGCHGPMGAEQHQTTHLQDWTALRHINAYHVSPCLKFPVLLHLCWVHLGPLTHITYDQQGLVCRTWRLELLELLTSHKVHVSTTIKITKRKSLVFSKYELLTLRWHSQAVQMGLKAFTRHLNLWGAGKNKPRILTSDSGPLISYHHPLNAPSSARNCNPVTP